MPKVSENRRFLVRDDGCPFFYLGDTAWAAIQRLDRDETDEYLRDRADKGFTVIQTVIVSEFEGLTAPNRAGAVPFVGGDPSRPNEAFFRHVDYFVERAGALGLHVGLLPTWGDKVGPVRWGTGPEAFTPENAEGYGAFLGRRYRDAPVIWIVGGDRDPLAARHFATWRALATGLDRGDGGRHPMTFHPQGRSSSSRSFHGDDWLDFNMIQSGHRHRDFPNHEMIEHDYCLLPIKPALDGEPCYEDHPVVEGEGYFSDSEARRAAYRALFAGACGHTYGANGIFQAWRPGLPDRFGVRRPWREALALPGAAQLRHARTLLESRPFLDRIPDQALLVGGAGEGPEHRRGCRAADGSYALIYSPTGTPFTVDLGQLSGERAVAHWYDPRNGTAREAGTWPGDTAQGFTPPSSGPGADWVLVLDDPTRGFPTPGQA
jgi:hypothetical protein